MTLPSAFERFKHIAIEGPIGVGKSTLANKLAARFGTDLLLERADENPFLDRFYKDMPGYAFQTQLAFLFQRVRQMQAAAQPGMFAASVISDFIFQKDALFARMNLSDEEFRLYSQMYAQVAPQVREPDLVIWLQAPPHVLMQRIRRRAVPMEQDITEGYLTRLCDAYVDFFRAYDAAPVFAVGTEYFNPVDRESDFALLTDSLASFGGPREFFNGHIEMPLG